MIAITTNNSTRVNPARFFVRRSRMMISISWCEI